MIKDINNFEKNKRLFFPYGFFITNDKENKNNVLFKDLEWEKTQVGDYHFFIHPNQKLYLEKDEIIIFLIGHAYNPFDLVYEEPKIIKKLLVRYKKNIESFYEYLNQLTGLFAVGLVKLIDEIIILNDATGMQTVYYGKHGNSIYITSHTYLLEEVLNLEMSMYVKQLISYKYYHLLGKHMPGDITPYDGFYRLVPNFYLTYKNEEIKIYRFYPNKKNEVIFHDEYGNTINEISKILINTMDIICKKWGVSAISMTGGVDSKTTLSCTKNNYDNYKYFSYISNDEEKVDALAANKIAENLGLNHEIHVISKKNNDFPEYEDIKKIIEINSGNIGKSNENDIRKRIYYLNNTSFDVEVKSWASEIGRAYYHKRFLKKRFPQKPRPRYLTTLYKVFVNKRKLVKQTNEIFKNYMDKYLTKEVMHKINWVDLFFWEFRVGSWNGLVITGEHRISFDITIPYNNRILLTQFLSIPVEKRIKDIPHKDIMKKANPQVAEMNISVTNVKHTKNRARLERLYLEIHSRLPF